MVLKYKRSEEEYELGLNIFEVRLEDKLPSAQLLDTLFYECQCVILLIDITSASSIEKIKTLVNIIKQAGLHKKFPYLVFHLISNKCDLETSRSVSGYEIKEFLDNNHEIKQADLSLKKSKEQYEKLVDSIYQAQTDLSHKISMNIISISQDILFTNQTTIKIVLLGDSGVGKTALMNRHFKNEFNEAFLSTIGIDEKTETVRIRNKEVFKVQIWDTAGQERFRCLPRKYYQNADGILLLFSNDSAESFTNVEKWMTEIKQNNAKTNSNGEALSDRTTIFMLGNKCDIPNRQVSKEEGEALGKTYNIEYVETSSKLNINIDEIITRMILDCYSKSSGLKDCFNLNEIGKSRDGKATCC